jgi:hypothetical protein
LNLLEAYGSHKEKSVGPLIYKNVLGGCLLFTSSESPEGRDVRSLVIRNLGLLSQGLAVPGEVQSAV